MAVSIRLHRAGANKQPSFRIVAADSRRATSGKILEILGWYDPKKSTDNVSIKLDRLEDWCRKGAHMSETVRALVHQFRRSAGATA